MKTQIDFLKEGKNFLMVLKAKYFQQKNRHRDIKTQNIKS